ncbi:hypothetical protein ACLMJK_002246 [Lecanora helva]
MVVVAIAGGTGGVGRTIVDAITEAGKHKAIILSRIVPASTTINGPRRIAVDYHNIEHMKQLFQENNVEVVISAMLLVDKSVARSQINLIRAAAQSGTVTKFIPSEYYIDFHTPNLGPDIFTTSNIEAEEELSRHPELTWTLVRAGIFLDSLTAPHNPIKTYIDPFWVFVDIDYEQCVFPGDGSQSLVLTHSVDLGAYVERLINLPSKDWPRETFIAANKLQVKDLEPLFKKVTGRNFQVTYDSVEAINKGHITPLPSNGLVFEDPEKGEIFHQVELQVMLSLLSNAHELPGKDLAEMFPDVRTTNIEDFLKAGWALKQSKTS